MPLTAVQLALQWSPNSARSKEWVIGEDEDWRDTTHFRFGTAGAISLYINIILWFTEKKNVYPSRGPLKYFTYY